VQAQVETVVRISAGKSRDKDEHTDSSDTSSNSTSTGAGSGTAASSASSSNSSSAAGTSNHGSHAEKETSIEKGVDRIIDSQDNEFVLSAPPKDQVATLTLDPLLIQDLTFLFASAAVSVGTGLPGVTLAEDGAIMIL
jgi:hypothetical protein